VSGVSQRHIVENRCIPSSVANTGTQESCAAFLDVLQLKREEHLRHRRLRIWRTVPSTRYSLADKEEEEDTRLDQMMAL
jgi:hypothetical protein